MLWMTVLVVLAVGAGSTLGDRLARESAKRALRRLSRHDGGAPLPIVPSPPREEYQKLLCAYDQAKTAKECAQGILAQMPQH